LRILVRPPGAPDIVPIAKEGLATVVYNPAAGQRRGSEVAEATQLRLRESGWDVACFPTEGPGHASELARACSPEARRLVVVGGDGTLREAAEGLGKGVELGFVPMGNANVVARELGIPLDPRRSVDVASAGEVRTFDAVRANGRFVLGMVGVGYDGFVSRWMDRARSKGWTKRWYGAHADSLYCALGLAALLRPCPPVRLEVDGVEAATTYRHLVLCNIQAYAKGWAMTPGANPRDGLLDYQARRTGFLPFSLWSLAGAALRRRVPGFVAHYGRGERMRLRSERPFVWQADGDPMGAATELELEVVPEALRLVGPSV